MEFVPSGQDIIPPTAGKATKYRMVYNSLEFACKRVSKPSTPWHGGPIRTFLKQTKGGHGLPGYF